MFHATAIANTNNSNNKDNGDGSGSSRHSDDAMLLQTGEGHVTWSSKDGKRLRVFGGCAFDECSSAFVEYDIESGRWQRLSIVNEDDLKVTLSMKGQASAASLDGNRIFMFGGRRSPTAISSSSSDDGGDDKGKDNSDNDDEGNERGSHSSKSSTYEFSHLLNVLELQSTSSNKGADGKDSASGNDEDGGKWRWSQINIDGGDEPPSSIDSTISFLDHNQTTLVLFGGFTDLGVFNDVYTLDVPSSSSVSSSPSSSKWIKRATTGDVPAARRGHTMTMINDTLFLFGGTDGVHAYNDVHTLSCPDLLTEKTNSEDDTDRDESACAWKKMPTTGNAPSGRFFHAAIHHRSYNEDQLVVVMGCDPLSNACYNDVYALDTASRVWYTVADIRDDGDSDDNNRTANVPRMLDSSINDDQYQQAWRPSPRKGQGFALIALHSTERTGVTRAKDVLALTGGCSTSACYNDVSFFDLNAVCNDTCVNSQGMYTKEFGVGECACIGDFHGEFCEKVGSCPNDCSGDHGVCSVRNDFHICDCSDGWWGPDCSYAPCPRNCSGHGHCRWYGTAMNYSTTLSGNTSRHDHGLSEKLLQIEKTSELNKINQVGSVCECEPGFMGVDCAVQSVIGSSLLSSEAATGVNTVITDHPADEAQAHSSSTSASLVETGASSFIESLFGSSAEPAKRKAKEEAVTVSDDVGESKGSMSQKEGSLKCPSACSGHGSCVANSSNINTTTDVQASSTGMCKCDRGFAGKDCSLECPKGCSGGNGVCQADGTCQCLPGYNGADCSGSYCAFNCSNHGVCVEEKCYCQGGFVGEFCHIDSTCSGHGEFLDKKCKCEDGYGLPDCSKRVVCKNGCSDMGDCVYKSLVDSSTHPNASIATDEAYLVLLQSNANGVSSLSSSSSSSSRALVSAEEVLGQCICRDGYGGDDCSSKSCPGNCTDSSHGLCNGDLGACDCFPGWGNDDCSRKVECPNNCTVDAGCMAHGVCLSTGVCDCYDEWTGEDCSQLACPDNCNDHGLCSHGQCVCLPGFYGDACDQSCLNECSGHGACLDTGKCVCEPFYDGDDCGKLKECPKSTATGEECDGHGVCHQPTQKCYCAPGYGGDDCSIPQGDCGEMDCSDHGACKDGMCFCDFGFEGDHCESKSKCPDDCHGNGFCYLGECECFTGFSGDTCSVFERDNTCPKKCSANGVCRHGRCFCVEGFEGDDCSQPTGFCKDNDCNGKGECKYGKCWCEPDRIGDQCEKPACEKGCVDGNGVCIVGECHCFPGFGGDDCGKQLMCPGGLGIGSCSGHGVCIQGTCACEPGYAGEDCSTITIAGPHCPSDCSENGVCFLGKCFCIDGFAGDDCSINAKSASCPLGCTGSELKEPPLSSSLPSPALSTSKQGENRNAGNVGGEDDTPARGICFHGQCFCQPGFAGAGCERELKCSEQCELNGQCFNGQCFCVAGWKGEDCNIRTDAAERRAKLEKDMDNAMKLLAKGGDGECAHGCNQHGLCIDGKCACEAGYTGLGCSEIVESVLKSRCVNDCHGNGECMFGKCFCHLGFGGVSCAQRLSLPCINDCSHHGVCSDAGRCECDFGYTGLSCEEEVYCDVDCGEHGVCLRDQCVCAKHYSGKRCTERLKADDDTSTNKTITIHKTGNATTIATTTTTINAKGKQMEEKTKEILLAKKMPERKGKATTPETKKKDDAKKGKIQSLDKAMNRSLISIASSVSSASSPATPPSAAKSKTALDCGTHGMWNGEAQACFCAQGWTGSVCAEGHPRSDSRDTDSKGTKIETAFSSLAESDRSLFRAQSHANQSQPGQPSPPTQAERARKDCPTASSASSSSSSYLAWLTEASPLLILVAGFVAGIAASSLAKKLKDKQKERQTHLRQQEIVRSLLRPVGR